MENIQKLHALGQSIWYDNIHRKLLENGALAALIHSGDIRGVTSNPSIFNAAIAKSNDYDAALKPMAYAGWSAEEIFYQLAVEDIRAAADLFRPLFDESAGGDGFVSLEVSPTLAHETERTAAEAQRLWQWVDRPNLMVKIPATVEGLNAIRKAIAAGVNVNVTLIFSLERYAAVIDAYLSGLEDRLAMGEPIGTVSSVASFFVSRVDSKVDQRLDALIKDVKSDSSGATHLMGNAAIANAKMAYEIFQKSIQSERFQKLARHGARKQRPLWASTSTKNVEYRDVRYVEELIGPDTVNTMPPQTLDAFRDHGIATETLTQDVPLAHQVIAEIESLGIAMDTVTKELEDEGVKSFADAFQEMLAAIDERITAAAAETGTLVKIVQARIHQLEQIHFVSRMFEKDATLWTSDLAGQKEARKRLGWLDAPQESWKLLPELGPFLQGLQVDGFTHALLLGMGGSSMAPEVLAQVFGVRERNGQIGLDLAILDSTDPAQVQAAADRSPIEKTLYIVASKSGTTSEVNAFFDFFYARAKKRVGKRAGQHFIAITDPGTALDQLAQERDFRHIFRADPQVGGRYSALTAFGVVPAALLGLDVERFLSSGEQMAAQCRPDVPAGRNPGLALGAMMGEAALHGRDKLTLLADDEISAVGAWLEQLIAESSGKNGTGIIPVDLEPLLPAGKYTNDRLFVYLKQQGTHAALASKLRQAGHPVIELVVRDEYDLPGQFYLWEFAIAVACSILGVNAFDQPDVQDSKDRTRVKVAAFHQTGHLEEGQPAWKGEDAEAFGPISTEMGKASTSGALLKTFLQQQVKEGDYVAINAYLPRNPRMVQRLQKLRVAVQALTGKPTTLGFGPRFLHSTGQLHKGGPDSGVFIQITEAPQHDLEIPEENIQFGVMERAQALGDFEALQARSRRVLRLEIKTGELPQL